MPLPRSTRHLRLVELRAGLKVRNASMAMAPTRHDRRVSRITWNNGDLICDSISHINNAAQITGTVNNQCPNLYAG